MSGHTNPALALLTSAGPTTQAAIRGTEGTNRALQQIEQRRRTGVAEGIQREGFKERKRATGVREEQGQQVIDVAAQKDIANRFGNLIRFTLEGDPAGIADRYTRSRAAAKNMGADVSSLPEQYTPDLLPKLQALQAQFTQFDPVSSRVKTSGVFQAKKPDGTFGNFVTQSRSDGSLEVREVGGSIKETPTEQIETEGGKAFSKAQGAARSKLITKAFETIEKINKNILNLDVARDLVVAGAGTGPIEHLFPSFRAASVELDQLRNELGLDVIGGVTFGALSKGELDLALNTGLPTGLDGPELIEWLDKKKIAQNKLRSNLAEAVQFFNGGGSIAEFIASKEDERNQARAAGDLNDTDLDARIAALQAQKGN